MVTMEDTEVAQKTAVDDAGTQTSPFTKAERIAAWEQTPMFPGKRPAKKLKDVPLDQITLEATGEQPDPDYAVSIGLVGLLQSVHLGVLEDGTYYVKEGRRRVIAAREAGLKTIPAIITGNDLSADYVRLAAHAIRHRNPAAEYNAITNLIAKNYGGEISNDSLDHLAKRTGSTRAGLTKLLSLGQLHQKLLDALMLDQISNPVAFSAAKMTMDQQQKALSIFEQNGKLTANDLREIRQARQEEQEPLPGLDPDLVATEDQRIVRARVSALAIRTKLTEYSELLSGKFTVSPQAIENTLSELISEANTLLDVLGEQYVPEANDDEEEDEDEE